MSEHTTGQVATSAAEIYETFFVPAVFGAWPPHLLNAAQVTAGQDILDVACGTGVLARAAAERVGPNGSVIGTDINDGMLAVAQQKAPHINWQVAPAGKLPFEDGRFDATLSQFGLMFFDNKPQAIAEMCRVTRSGGTAAVTVWGPLADTPGYVVMRQIIAELFGPEIAQSVAFPFSLGDPEKLGQLFIQAGAENHAIQTITETFHFPSIEDWLFTEIKGWTLAEVIDDEGYEALKEVALKRLTTFVQADGSVAFAAPAHIVTVAI